MIKAFENLTPEEYSELMELAVRVRPVNSELAKRYYHLLEKHRLFTEWDYEAYEDFKIK